MSAHAYSVWSLRERESLGTQLFPMIAWPPPGSCRELMAPEGRISTYFVGELECARKIRITYNITVCTLQIIAR